MHLDNTLQSILSQSERDFELIAVDDHSDDQSVSLLKKYNHMLKSTLQTYNRMTRYHFYI